MSNVTQVQSFTNWISTYFLGLMVTSAILYHVMHFFHITIEVRNVCVFLAPLFSSFTALVTYQLTKELKDAGAGLVAAAMIAIVPGKLLSSCRLFLSTYLRKYLQLYESIIHTLFITMFLTVVYFFLFLGYISRSVAGSYDNEGIAIFCMLLTYWLWIKSVKSGSLLWSTMCSLAYFYMVKILEYFLNFS